MKVLDVRRGIALPSAARATAAAPGSFPFAWISERRESPARRPRIVVDHEQRICGAVGAPLPFSGIGHHGRFTDLQRIAAALVVNRLAVAPDQMNATHRNILAAAGFEHGLRVELAQPEAQP